MALRREEGKSPELRVVRGRGRPRKAYAELDLSPDDDRRLRKHLAATFHDAGPSPHWYVPFPQERLGDGLTLKWIADYRAEYPDDWKRMLRTLRKSGGSTTWAQATAARKGRREIPDRILGDSILSDGDDPVYMADLAHLMGLYPGINGAQKLRPTNREGAYIDLDEITIEGEVRLTARECLASGRALSAEVRRRRFDAEIREILDAIARDEREYLDALRNQSPWLAILLEELYRLWTRKPIYVAFVPISEGPHLSEQ
jgi:hypothetical protein